MWAEIQTCRQKTSTSRLECLVEFERELGWGSAEPSEHPNRTEMSFRRPAKEREKFGGVVCTSKVNWDKYQANSEMTNQTCGEKEFTSEELLAVPVLRLSSLCFFWNKNIRKWWLRVWAVVGLVVDDVISFVGEMPMQYHRAVFEGRQCTETVHTYYKEPSGRAESDVIEPWLVDDSPSPTCSVLIGWRKI